MATLTDMHVLHVLLAVIALVQPVSAGCGRVPDFVSTNETAPNGTVLLTATKNQSDAVTFSISNRTDLAYRFHANLSQYFELIEEPEQFTLVITKALDLEFFFIEFKATLTTIELELRCSGTPPAQTFTTTIANTRVNEFKPVFNGSPYATEVFENTTVNSTVFNVRKNVTDDDVPAPSTFFFDIQNHTIQEADGRGYFYIHNTRGEIKLLRPLDYDSNGRRTMFLNISVSDGSSADKKTSYSDLHITVKDSDDRAPFFDFPNCTVPCSAPPYEAIITLDDKSPLNVKPTAISAKDLDTLGTPLRFAIQGGNSKYLFDINPITGAVGMQRSVRESGLPDAQFRLVLSVRKDLPNIDLSSIAILTVKVFERIPDSNGSRPIIKRPVTKNGGTSLLIPTIVLGILLLLLIVAIIAVVLFIRKKQKQMAVKPDGSEPQTEEEDIHSDRSDAMNSRSFSNERLVFNGKATIGIGTDGFPETPAKKRGLPPLPLRDTATETEGEVKRKKRSRKRNKNKEPEIFDGTREYNMGADPEFFDSTDKSKVKRSQRSYDKKSTPLSRITVPNDQPAED